MLAKLRWRGHRDRRGREAQWAAQGRRLDTTAVRQAYQQFAVPDLWIIENVVDAVDRASWHACAFQGLDQIAKTPVQQTFA